MSQKLTHLLKAIFTYPIIFIIKIYQYGISPLLGPKCRFTPTCSQYSIDAFKKHGVLKGFAYTINRVRKCHPWGGSGYDPVP